MSETSPEKPILLQGLDDVEDQDVDMAAPITSTPAGSGAVPAVSASTAATVSAGGFIGVSNTLIAQIVTPSPFQHHNDSATNDRYRSALQRVTSSPSSDVEAWMAIMNECMSLYRTQLLPELSEERNTTLKMMLDAAPPNARVNITRNELLEKKLDWVESCHGHLLQYFPYASHYFVSAVEILMARSALPFESLTGGDDDFSFGGVNNWNAMESQKAAARKIDKIFEHALGVKPDGSPAASSTGSGDDGTGGSGNGEGEEPTAMQVLGGMCTSSVELWLLYIRKRTRDAKRQALLSHSAPSIDPNNPTMKPMIKLTPVGEEMIRDWIVGAYETALNNGSAFVFNNHLVWKQYLTYVKSWNIMSTNPTVIPGQEPMIEINHSLQAKQKELLRAIYQRIITHPMLGLDALWMEYEAFEKAQSEQLASALIAENLPKYQHARSVYLERNRVYSFHSLKFGRLATPPADYEFVDENGNKKDDIDEESYKTKLQDECELLSKWKRRVGYERTNPERLSAAELTFRIRQCYKDTICCFMRHIEIWHEWSTWELLNTGGSGVGASVSTGSAGTGMINAKKRHVSLATCVLELAQKHIPDSTLLAYGQVQILESQISSSSSNGRQNGAPAPSDEAIQVMSDFCDRAGNTLGYVLLQRLVRKYKGVKEARAVFSDARRKLRVRPEDSLRVQSHSEAKVADGEGKEDAAGEVGVAGTTIEGNGNSRTLVMDRNNFHASTSNTTMSESNMNKDISMVSSASIPTSHKGTGYITWHLYSSHAEIEHRLNTSPKVASRVFELGLRKHRSFLSTPQYVLQYSKLLLELGEEENLRALLMRAISACEEEGVADGDDSSDGKMAATRREALRPLWDLMLKFETMLQSRSGDLSAVQSIEARRRKSLYGPNNENLTGGKGLSGDDGEVGIGMQKSSVSDTLIRVDGYDISSRIANGLDRMVDSLEVSGILGQESMANILSFLSSISPGAVWKDDGAGGASDASFRRRRQFKSEMHSLSGLVTGSANASTGGMSSSTTGRLMSAKERLAQSAAQSQNTTVLAAVQSSPEWLRGMLMLLPATLRNYRGAKAPPHLIEMALAALRDNPLPSVRPSTDGMSTQNGNGGLHKRQRKEMDDGNSSDEENFGSAGGYGDQFRNRQRARMLGAASSAAS